MSADPHNQEYQVDETIKRIAAIVTIDQSEQPADKPEPPLGRPRSMTFPYLEIAKRYNVDYTGVLVLAHFETYGKLPGWVAPATPYVEPGPTRDLILADVRQAVSYFEWVRRHGWEF